MKYWRWCCQWWFYHYTGVYGGGTLICSAPHGTADGPETVDMVRLFAHITGSICLTVSGFLETGIDKGFRVNVNRNTEKHWTRTGSGTDPSSVWNTYEKATTVSAAANHWYENAVRCAVDYPDIFSDSPSASSGGALRGTFPFAVQHHSFVKQEGVNIMQTGAEHGQGYRHNETVRTPYFNSEPLRPSTLHIYPLPPSLYCPAMPTSKKLGMFVELHFNSNPDFVRQMHIASKGVNVVEGQCIIDHISAFVAYDHNKIGTQTVEPLELVVEPVMSSWYSFRSTTSVSRWTNKGMIVELNSKLPHSVKNLYISAFSFAVINCFN